MKMLECKNFHSILKAMICKLSLMENKWISVTLTVNNVHFEKSINYENCMFIYLFVWYYYFIGRCCRYDIQSFNNTPRYNRIIIHHQRNQLSTRVHRRMHEHNVFSTYRTVLRTTVRKVQDKLFKQNTRRLSYYQYHVTARCRIDINRVCIW